MYCNIPDFIGPFKESLPKFINYKRSLGYDYTRSTVTKLLEMDTFFSENGYTKIEVTQEMHDLWIKKRDNEKKSTQSRRISIIKIFSEFLIENGYDNIYLAHISSRPFKSQFIPYIYSNQEISNILNNAKNITNCSYPHDIKTFSVILTLLYGSGLRISECLNIKIKDIDNGAIKILDSKNHVSRLIIVSDSVKSILDKYIDMSFYVSEDYLFKSKNDKRINIGKIYSMFKKVLKLSGVYKCNGRGGPRIHDLRHTFAIHSLEQMIKKGYDIYTSLPLLSKYLGHAHIYDTEYYLRFTKYSYDNVANLTDNIYHDVFPSVEVISNE